MLEDLNDSGRFATLDSKVSASLGRNLNGDLGRKINLLEEKAALAGKMLKGRQTLWLIYESYRINDTEGAILEFKDLLTIKVKNENPRQFINDWEMCLIGMKAIPSEDIMESLFITELEKCSSLKSVLALYKQDVTQRGMPKDYERLMGMVRIQLEEIRRNKNRYDMENGVRGKGFPGKANNGKNTRKGMCVSSIPKEWRMPTTTWRVSVGS